MTCSVYHRGAVALSHISEFPALHPSKIAPVGTSGGNCSVRRLDLSYNKLGAETGHSMNQVRVSQPFSS